MTKLDCLCSGVKVAALKLQVEEFNVQEAIRVYHRSAARHTQAFIIIALPVSKAALLMHT